MASHLLAVAAKEFDRFKSCLETGSNVCEVTYKSGNINLSCPDRNACDANALGGLVRCLFVAGLWPITLETTSNIRTILSAFASMKTISRYLPQDPSSTAHDLCGSGLPLQVEAQAVHTAIKGLNLSDFYLLDEIFFPIDDEGSLLDSTSSCSMRILITKKIRTRSRVMLDWWSCQCTFFLLHGIVKIRIGLGNLKCLL